jgi:uncharacterized protein (TIGR00369 family)
VTTEDPRPPLAAFAQYVPHNRALGIRFVGQDDEGIILGLPYSERIVGNPFTGVIHGGAITAVLDAACGLAVLAKLREPLPVATLDLRIDYLGPATPEKELFARAECFKVTKRIAFVRCRAYHEESPGDAVAVANGTFMLFRGRVRGRGLRR